MSSQGPLSPSSVGDGELVYDTSWVGHANAIDADEAYATASLTTGADGPLRQDGVNPLLATGFSFSIPGSATIDGVEVGLLRYAGSDFGNNYAVDTGLYLVKEGFPPAGANRASNNHWPLNPTAATYGGPSDTWGLTLTPADVNAFDFGVWLEIFLSTDAVEIQALLDHVTLTIYYTDASGGQHSESLTLYLQGHAALSEVAPLYINGWAPGTGSALADAFPLFMRGHRDVSEGMPLFTEGASLGATVGSIPLVTAGPSAQSASIPLVMFGSEGRMVPLGYTGQLGTTESALAHIALGLPRSSNGGFPLFIFGHETNPIHYNTISLFMRGSSSVGPEEVPLFVQGAHPAAADDDPTAQLGISRSRLANILLGRPGSTSYSRGMSLYVRGIAGADIDAGFDPPFPLFIKGEGRLVDGVPLFIGSTPFASMPLFLQADPRPTDELALSLSIHGSVTDGVAGGLPLFIWADTGDNVLTPTMPLFLLGPDRVQSVRNMNLFIEGAPHYAAGGVDLVVCNTQTSAIEVVPLFLKGPEGTDGAYPFHSQMNLVLNRDTADAITLYTQGPGVSAGEVMPLYIFGAYGQSELLALAMPEVVGSTKERLILYTHGF